MANIVLVRRCQLGAPVVPETLPGMLYATEDAAHQFVIAAVRGEYPVALAGEVSALFIRPDDATVVLSGEIIEGRAVVTLSRPCYELPGVFSMAVFVESEGVKTAVYAAMGTIRRTSSDAIVDPTRVVPGIEDIIAQYGAMQQAVADLEEAKESGEFDGFSPTVTVTDIEGGHRVVITDVVGAHTFDVMDGSGGGGGVFIAEYNVTTYAELQAAYEDGQILICKYMSNNLTVYSALYAYLVGNGFRFNVRGLDPDLQSYTFNCLQRTGWSMSAAPYNAITSVGTVESGDYLAFVDSNGLNRLTRSNSLTFGTDPTKYLANDGTWRSVPDLSSFMDWVRTWLDVVRANIEALHKVSIFYQIYAYGRDANNEATLDGNRITVTVPVAVADSYGNWTFVQSSDLTNGVQYKFYMKPLTAYASTFFEVVAKDEAYYPARDLDADITTDDDGTVCVDFVKESSNAPRIWVRWRRDIAYANQQVLCWLEKVGGVK